ncbi:MAG TPA: glutamine synthetase family protein [Chloroflexia bacterium]|nr:glutamine synthetase family protein [Chloroflexia bacterium]
MSLTIDVKNEVLRLARESGVKQVRFLYCDNGSIIRGKACGYQSLEERMYGGIGLTVAMQAMNSLDELTPVEGIGAVGEVRLVPDPRTFRILPYSPRTASMLCDMLTLEGLPWELCPRSFLRRMIEQAHSEFGQSIIAAFEPEWSLARRSPEGAYVAIDDSLCFSTIGMTTPAAMVDELLGALEAQNLKVEQYHPELAHGQQELSISPARALEAADNQLIYRETVRAVAWNHGLFASFAPKPFINQAGNGCHVHLSAWAGDQGDINMFYDPSDRYSLSQTGYYFIGGILEHLPALVALTCPSVNSYRRLQPHSWSSAYTCYGPDNREAAVRIASTLKGKESRSINLELKSSDNTNNPYLALGGIIAAGMDGVRRKLHPGEKLMVTVDPGTLPEEERLERGIKALPTSLGQALDNLEKDEVLLNALGPLLARTYIAVKRSEEKSYAARTTEYEVNQHFYKY